ncbi:microcystin-dependent protein [Azospirillum agricola]|uniref:phage tail protein n=1 Tax=Azospirillum agricola TaxID=1720247 RepID=UPI001AE5592C|nr:tail fiber protein [Azospirillum agricola]MBP2230996.1 microcystin-dependent protein [Azospirillum agricola]
MDMTIGMIFVVAFDWAPRDTAYCRGQTVSVNQNQALFSLLGFRYGGDNASNFGIPDLQGRVPIGTGTTTWSPLPTGQKGGNASVTLSQANLPVHTHGASFTPVVSPTTIEFPAVAGNLSVAGTMEATTNTTATNIPGGSNTWLGAPSSTSIKMYGPAGGTNVPLSGLTMSVSGSPSLPKQTTTINSVVGGSVAIGSAGGSAAVSLIQPFLALNFVIAMQGIYPNRP